MIANVALDEVVAVVPRDLAQRERVSGRRGGRFEGLGTELPRSKKLVIKPLVHEIDCRPLEDDDNEEEGNK